MKAIMISIRLKYFYLTYKGIKTIEVRKSMPKNFNGIVYEYVSKTNWKKDLLEIPENEREFFKKFVGKVGLKFKLKTVNKYEIQMALYNQHSIYKNGRYHGEIESTKNDIVDLACLSPEVVVDYIDEHFDEPLYGWVIDNLEIFDEPKELSEFKRCTEKTCIYGKCHKYMHCLKPLTKAPQSWMFIETEE